MEFLNVHPLCFRNDLFSWSQWRVTCHTDHKVGTKSSAFFINLYPGYDLILLILVTSHIAWLSLLHLHHHLHQALTPSAITQTFWALAETTVTLSHSYKYFQLVILNAASFNYYVSTYFSSFSIWDITHLPSFTRPFTPVVCITSHSQEDASLR